MFTLCVAVISKSIEMFSYLVLISGEIECFIMKSFSKEDIVATPDTVSNEESWIVQKIIFCQQCSNK